MIGVRDVMTKRKKEDYFYIWFSVVNMWGIGQFQFAIERLNEIVQKATGIIFYLESPKSKAEGKYKLCCVNPNYKDK